MQRIGLAMALAAFGIGEASDPKFVGQYNVVRFENGKRTLDKDLPPGQLTWMELRKNGTWEMANMMSGWSGTWKVTKGKIQFRNTVGPAGKIDKPTVMTFIPTPDRRRLVLVTNAKAYGIELIYNPEARAQIAKRMEQVLRKLGQGPKP